MSASDGNEAGIFPVAATVPFLPVIFPVFPVFLPIIIPVFFLPVFFPFWLLVILEGLILEDERGERGVLKIFGLVFLDASNHKGAEGGFSIVPGLVRAAHVHILFELELRSSRWVGAPGLASLFRCMSSFIGLSNPFEVHVAVV